MAPSEHVRKAAPAELHAGKQAAEAGAGGSRGRELATLSWLN